MVDNNDTGLRARFHRPSSIQIGMSVRFWMALGLFLIVSGALIGHNHVRMWVLCLFVLLPFYIGLVFIVGSVLGFNDREPAPRTGRTFEHGQPYYRQEPREFMPRPDDVVSVDNWQRFLKRHSQTTH